MRYFCKTKAVEYCEEHRQDLLNEQENDQRWGMTMTNLNELKVTNTEYSLESGFFWVEFENGKTLQLCLVEKEQTEEEHFKNGTIYQPKISASDNGFNWGLCADCNSWAVDDEDIPPLVNHEWGHIEEFLLEKAREAGLEIVP